MTVESTTRRAQYDTNGTTGPWTVPFYFLANADLAVIYTDASGLEATLTLTTHYSVTGAGAAGGGTVTTVSSYAAGGTITILRNVELLQETDYVETDAFPAAAHETALDRLTMIAQQQSEQLDRALLLPAADEMGGALPSAAARANTTLGFDSDGAPTVLTPTSGSAADVLTRLADTSDVARGDALIGVKSILTGAQARTQHDRNADTVSVFDFMTTAQIADVKASSISVDVTTAVQAAIDASYGRRLFFPRGGYLLSAPLEIDPIYNGASNLPMTLTGEGFDANGGNGGTFLKISHSGNGITIDNSYGINADARFIIEGMGIIGDGTDATGGDGIYAKNVSNLICRDLWVQDMRRNGIYFERCYGSAVQDCTLLRNRVWNFYAEKAFNLGDLQRIKAYGGGRAYTSGISGNVCIRGTADENLGVVVSNVDVSYAGANAYTLFKRSNSTLTNIVVSAGTATATTSAAHGIATGSLIAVVGATVDPALNTGYPVAATSTGATTFTFTTSAANGTYTDAGLQIGPGAFGFFIDQTRGLVLHGYSEDCIGPALYMGADVDSFEVIGGYWQGASGGAVIINDSAQHGRYSAMYLTGSQARMLVNVPDGEHGVDVAESITLGSGATLTLPTIYMRGGTYYGPAYPTAGTWTAGKYIKRSNPTGGQPKGWYCTVGGGSGGTWVSEGNL